MRTVPSLAAATVFAALIVLPAEAQVTVRDLVVTGGASVEGYQGNMSSVTIPLVDSTDNAAAAVGEFGARGQVSFVNNAVRGFRLDFDGGMRQYAASGFQVADYSPREVVGRTDAIYRQSLGDLGTLHATFGLKGRSVVDRPPMPLFIQPGYGTTSGSVRLSFAEVQGIMFDGEVMAEWSDYRAHELFPQLDLLDNSSTRIEMGGSWGRDWRVRFYGALRFTEFQRQQTNLERDPFRRDHMVETGMVWMFTSPVVATVGVAGIFNRSNSARPEYDAVRVRGNLVVPLAFDVNGSLYASLTGKSYKHDVEFARLVPGEEADNGSVVYAALSRPFAPTLDAQVRFGWTRAETDFGGAFYERYGVSFFVNFRPLR